MNRQINILIAFSVLGMVSFAMGQSLNPTGSISVHDPVMIKEGNTYYVFHTGSLVPVKTSSNKVNWSSAGSAFSSSQSWWSQLVPNRESGNRLWAPDIIYRDGQFWLYYSISSFGQNRSAIGVATRNSLSSGSWQDQGVVINTTGSENHNAIDPNIVVDENGTPWMSWGSFWTGLKIIELDPATGKPASGAQIISLATRPGVSENPIEAPFIIRRGGYYYLFMSFDFCCRGNNSTYNMRYARSTSVTGPYTDKSGTPTMQGGGTRIDDGTPYAGGHQAIFEEDGQHYLVYHVYNGGNRLQIRYLYFDDQAWPTLDPNEASPLIDAPSQSSPGFQNIYSRPLALEFEESTQLVIYDFLGKQVTEKKNVKEARFPELKPGTYFLSLKSSGREILRRIVLY